MMLSLKKTANFRKEEDYPVENQVCSTQHQCSPSSHQQLSRLLKDQPIDNIIGKLNNGVVTRSQTKNICVHFSFVSE